MDRFLAALQNTVLAGTLIGTAAYLAVVILHVTGGR